MTQTKSGPPRAIGYVRVSTKDQGENGFGLEADGRPPHPDTIRQRFDRLAAAAGLSRITFHDLRHSYATIMSSVGPDWLWGKGSAHPAST